MGKPDISNFDASTRASSELEYVLRNEKQKDEGKRISVEEALKAPRVYHADTTRNVTRVLFISRDESLLNPELQSLDGYLNVRELFDEVHIVILREGIPPKNPVLRASDNVWIYTAAAATWIGTPKAGVDLITKEMVFASGFRPDLIVARDPFESALVAHTISKRYNCPAQLHVLEDYTAADFTKRAPHNYWRRYIPRYTVGKFLSVRTATGGIENMISKKFTIPDISTLPRFQNYQLIAQTKATIDLREIYKPFLFVMLYIGKLNHESTLYRAIDAARFALRNKRVGLVVLGDGPAKGEFEKRAKLLGIEQQIVFEKMPADIVPYLKSASLLIATDTDTDSDEIVFKAAAAGLPLVMSRTPSRDDVFEHSVSGYLCEATDVQAFTDRISDVLNNVTLRKVFAERAQNAMEYKFHQDPEYYKEAYRTSIEQALFVVEDSKTPLE
jgi:glycosyltransferase involved in cell wall biosynthesis